MPAVLVTYALVFLWICSVDRARGDTGTAPRFVHADEIRRVGSFLLWTWFPALAFFYFPKMLAGEGFPGDKWFRTETGWMPIGLLAGVAVTLVIVAVYEFWWREQWHSSRFLNSLPAFRNVPPDTDPYRGLHALSGVLTALIPLGALAVFLVEHLYFDAVWSPVWLVCLFLALFNSAYGFVAFHFAGLQYVSALLVVLILAVANIGHEYKMALPGVDAYYTEGRRPDLDGPVPKLPDTLTLIDTKKLLATNSANWNATRDRRKGAGYDPPKPRLVIIATTGGGIQASVWTSLVMDALQNDENLKLVEFHNQIRLITGASGGMQGAGLHVADFGNPRPNQTRLDEQLARDSLWPTLQTMLTHDMPGALVPKRFDNDRGKQLEAAWWANTLATDWKRDVPNWVRNLYTPPRGPNSLDSPLTLTFDKLKEQEEKCERPVLVFSPMLVEDCRRVMISNLSLDWFTATTARHQNKELTFPNVADPNTLSVPALEFWRYFPDAHSKFKVSTAARMSASFPFVGPAVSLPTNPPRRVVDAGYFDNFGINFAAMWLNHYKKEICEHTSGVVIVEIRAYPRREEKLRYKVTQPDGTLDEGGYTWALSEFSSPLEAIYNLYARSAYFRNDQLLHMLDESFNGRGELPKGARPFFTIATFECPQPAALSWTLPERNYNELCAIVHGTQILPGASQNTKDRIEKTREQVDGARDGLRRWFAGETLPPKP
ncbi:MAG: patatin-like phospholipase family protein [Planctomycetes bacterium]|nr:patatin-like phospholipase family protein [Planctomycetota bacterium]